VNTALEWVNLSSAHVWVILPARFRVNTALEWVNLSPAYIRVNYYIDEMILSASVGKALPSGAWVILPSCFQVCTVFEYVNCNTPVKWVHVSVAQIQFVDYYNALEHISILTKESQVFWRAPTMKYDVVDYPVFVFHLRQCHFLSFSQTSKLYAHHISQYWLVKVVELMMHWSNHLCHFLFQNMILLVNFDLTPQQHCKKAYLTMCQSQCYKNDFAVVSSSCTFSTNIVVAEFVKYAENVLC